MTQCQKNHNLQRQGTVHDQEKAAERARGGCKITHEMIRKVQQKILQTGRKPSRSHLEYVNERIKHDQEEVIGRGGHKIRDRETSSATRRSLVSTGRRQTLRRKEGLNPQIIITSNLPGRMGGLANPGQAIRSTTNYDTTECRKLQEEDT